MWRSSKIAKSRKGERGFTLTELLVATAITVIVLGGILGVLLSVMRATARGHAIQQAYELARGTYESIEGDLAAAYMSRDTGDDFVFFGCPFGFTFIAALDPDDPDRLSRVSYFIHAESIYDGTIEFYDETTGGYIPKGTVSLVRYVEPGVTDLDWYPVDWVDDVVNLDVEGIALPYWQNVSDELAGTLVTVSNFSDDALSILEAYSGVRSADPDRRDVPTEHDLMIRAKLREIWIRMLAGDPNLPSYFEASDPNRPSLTDLDWRDYVIAERLPYQTRGGDFLVDTDGVYSITRSMVDYTNPELVRPQYFTYGTRFNIFNTQGDYDLDGEFNTELDQDLASDSIDMFTTFWGSVYNVTHAEYIYVPKGNVEPYGSLYSLGSPLDPAMPELIGVSTGVELSSPFVGVPEFDEDFVQIIDVPVGYRRKTTRPFDELFYTVTP